VIVLYPQMWSAGLDKILECLLQRSQPTVTRQAIFNMTAPGLISMTAIALLWVTYLDVIHTIAETNSSCSDISVASNWGVSHTDSGALEFSTERKEGDRTPERRS